LLLRNAHYGRRYLMFLCSECQRSARVLYARYRAPYHEIWFSTCRKCTGIAYQSTRLWPSLLGAVHVVQPETILRWHRAGFTAFWRWKSRKRAGRPKIARELRDLIRRMSKENPKWGASRIHGELLMLGFEVAQSTVSKYLVQGGSPSRAGRHSSATTRMRSRPLTCLWFRP
jgi:hypothetical protein